MQHMMDIKSKQQRANDGMPSNDSHSEKSISEWHETIEANYSDGLQKYCHDSLNGKYKISRDENISVEILHDEIEIVNDEIVNCKLGSVIDEILNCKILNCKMRNDVSLNYKIWKDMSLGLNQLKREASASNFTP